LHGATRQQQRRDDELMRVVYGVVVRMHGGGGGGLHALPVLRKGPVIRRLLAHGAQHQRRTPLAHTTTGATRAQQRPPCESRARSNLTAEHRRAGAGSCS
jgi:hypothetical protein